jgi:hypothetical protein
MPQTVMKNAPPEQFELFDNPGGGRIAGIAAVLLGAAFVFFVWYEFPREAGQKIWALFAALVGLCAIIGGAMLYWLSLRAPYLILRADGNGLRVVERFRFHREPIYLLLPWGKIREFRLRPMGEAGYAMEIQANLAAEEEERIRALLKFSSPPGILLFEIPLNWLPVSDQWIGDILRAIAARARGESTRA